MICLDSTTSVTLCNKLGDILMAFKKKKGGSYVVTWDSDASSSDDDDDSDDHKTTKKKVLASFPINEKPSFFDTPSCFMAKATKV